jgi:hypothetical protein
VADPSLQLFQDRVVDGMIQHQVFIAPCRHLDFDVVGSLLGVVARLLCISNVIMLSTSGVDTTSSSKINHVLGNMSDHTELEDVPAHPLVVGGSYVD